MYSHWLMRLAKSDMTKSTPTTYMTGKTRKPKSTKLTDKTSTTNKTLDQNLWNDWEKLYDTADLTVWWDIIWNTSKLIDETDLTDDWYRVMSLNWLKRGWTMYDLPWLKRGHLLFLIMSYQYWSRRANGAVHDVILTRNHKITEKMESVVSLSFRKSVHNCNTS